MIAACFCIGAFVLVFLRQILAYLHNEGLDDLIDLSCVFIIIGTFTFSIYAAEHWILK